MYLRRVLPSARQALTAMTFAVALVASAVAAVAAQPAHVNFSSTYEGEVCGIPVTVTEKGQLTERETIRRDGSYLFRGTFTLTVTYTTADGASVVERDATVLTAGDPIIDADAGTITWVNVLRGIPVQLKLPHGPILLLDAGDSTIAFTFDLATDEFVSFEIIELYGPHPQPESGFEAYCEVVIDALA